MTNLSPTGARILTTHVDGVVTGHPAAMARLESDGLVRLTRGGRILTDAGWAALRARQAEHPHASERPAALTEILPKLPAKQHEAVVSAARRPDQLVADRVDQAYWDGATAILGAPLGGWPAPRGSSPRTPASAYAALDRRGAAAVSARSSAG